MLSVVGPLDNKALPQQQPLGQLVSLLAVLLEAQPPALTDAPFQLLLLAYFLNKVSLTFSVFTVLLES